MIFNVGWLICLSVRTRIFAINMDNNKIEIKTCQYFANEVYQTQCCLVLNDMFLSCSCFAITYCVNTYFISLISIYTIIPIH